MKQFVESASAFFNAFLEEELRFSSSMYLCLVWIRVLKHVFQNPDQAAKHLKNHPFLKKLVARPSMGAYIEGLCNSLQSLYIGSPVQKPCIKRRLTDMLTNSSDDEDDVPASSKVSWNTESEDDGLSAMSILPVDIPERSSSPKEKSKKQKKAKKH